MSSFTRGYCSHSLLTFSLVLISLSAAGQTATDVDCVWCVNQGEISPDSVGWVQLEDQLQQGLSTQRNDIGDLQNRVLALEAIATQAGMTVLANGEPIGKLISVHYGPNTAPGRSPNISFADSITILTLQGYPVTIDLTGELVRKDRDGINYLEPNCAGQPYIGLGGGPGWVPEMGMVVSTPTGSQFGPAAYVPKGSEIVFFGQGFEQIVESRTFGGPCREASPGSESAYFPQAPVLPNDEAITGVPNSGSYPDPITLAP